MEAALLATYTMARMLLAANSSAANRGGAIYNSNTEDARTVLNCSFNGNTAANGGGMYNFYCSPTVINCTFNANSASSDGDYRAGGMLNWHTSSPVVTNCVFWGNSTFDGTTDEAAQLNYGAPVVNYCCVQGWTGALGGTGNFGDDPLFVESLGADNIPGTEDDNPRLLAGSPSLDAGDNLAVPPSLLTDLDGNPRIINGTVDMGAYEGPKQGFLLSSQPVTVPESQTATFTVALATDPLETVQVTVAYHSGDPDITVQSGTLLTFNSSNYSSPQTVTLAAAEDADYLHGKALIWVSAAAFVTAALDATEVDNDVPAVLYVDADALGANDGTSWENAFTNLQDAISIAAEYRQVHEIRVAQGIYKPDQGANQTPGDTGATFQLINGLTIKGGYAGFGKPDPNARSIELYETILSGDLNSDDIQLTNPADMFWSEPSRSDNSEFVVTGSDTDANAVLDGFTVTAGYSGQLGGGMCNEDGSPTVTNCTFTWNFAEWGGGMGNWNSSPQIISCKFESNAAAGGGGIDNVENSNPILINCTFSSNFGSWMGGGMVNGYAGFGGSANPVLINCIFSGNSTYRYGGGMYNEGSSPTIANCTFNDNSAERGGAIYSYRGSNPTLTNCILYGDTGMWGREIYVAFYSESQPATTTVNYSNVQDSNVQERPAGVYIETGSTLNWGVGNIDIDPCFVEPGYWADANDPNIVVEPNDPNSIWVDGDYHLKSEGWRWDTQRKVWKWDDVTSRCIDAGNPGSPLGEELLSVPYDPNNEWGENLRINMGAFGGTAEASMPPYDWALLADLTNDGIVDCVDLGHWAENWLISSSELPGDLDRNGIVDTLDFALLGRDWFEETSWHEPEI
jgi:predicted outer membrane repeat protein